MNKINLLRSILIAIIMSVTFLGTYVGSAQAQGTNAPWTQCTDGRVIVRCESYDCPSGDTSGDGKCTTLDTNARLTDARNDSFCANPLSGCGEVRYFSANSSNTCSVRVEENNNNCDLYSAANPNFTARPSASPTATPKSGISQCNNLTATPFEGPVPLRVTFQGDAVDPNGSIKEYEFEFKGETGTVGSVVQKSGKVTQTFDKPGEYSAKLTIVDSAGKRITSQACQTTVTVRKATTKGGGDLESDEKLPETGSEMWVGAALIALGGIGVFMYERYRVI